MLEQILHYDRVERLICERKRLLDVAAHHVSPKLRSGMDGLR